ncbi:MAG: hypothetical protein K2J82_07685 [Muribaculaceae bacterium]|nr:hypothetical protein [Muribaculaceae bacterium]
MTVIEKQYMDSVININRIMRKSQDAEPDWEQRRYEIAKDVMANMIGAVVKGAIDKRAMYDPNHISLAKSSVNAATALVNELKNTQEKK